MPRAIEVQRQAVLLHTPQLHTQTPISEIEVVDKSAAAPLTLPPPRPPPFRPVVRFSLKPPLLTADPA